MTFYWLWWVTFILLWIFTELWWGSTDLCWISSILWWVSCDLTVRFRCTSNTVYDRQRYVFFLPRLRKQVVWTSNRFTSHVIANQKFGEKVNCSTLFIGTQLNTRKKSIILAHKYFIDFQFLLVWINFFHYHVCDALDIDSILSLHQCHVIFFSIRFDTNRQSHSPYLWHFPTNWSFIKLFGSVPAHW